MTPPDQLPIHHDTDRIPILSQPHLESHSDYGRGQLPGRRGQPFKFGDLGNFWRHTEDTMNTYHDRMMKDLTYNLDNLLIFAALFSAVNSTFIGYSLPNLTSGPADQTNKLLQLMLQGYDNSTLTPDDLKEDVFTPTARDIFTNQMFCISLAFSLIAAFGALLGQQWVIRFKSERWPDGSALARWERQRKLRGAQRWGLLPFIGVVLPALLQLSLFTFTIGFIDLLHKLYTSVATPIIALTGLSALFYLLATLACALDPYCPFRTSIPHILSALFRTPTGWIGYIFPGVSSYLNRVEMALAKCLGIIRRKPETIAALAIGSACQNMETSEDRQVLLDIARNIPFSGETLELAGFYKNSAAMGRLRELARKETGDNTVFSEALTYLELSLKPQDPKALSPAQKVDQLAIFERVAEGFIRNQTQLVSFLPTSVATVTFVATCIPPLEAEKRSLRPHQEYLLASLARGCNPFVTVGLVAWMLLSGREFIPNKRTRHAVLSDMGIIHGGRPKETRQELDDIIIALQQFEGLGTWPSAEAQSRFLRFVLHALRNCHGQARNTHKFIVVLTTGLGHLLADHLVSWQTKWKDLLFLIESLNPLLADSGSQARPLSGDVGEGESEDDWNQASQDAVNLMDAACEIIGRWKTPNKFSEAAVASDALLAPFAQYIKRLTERYRNGKRPYEPLPFEVLAQSIQNTPRDGVTCDDLIYAEFTNAWRLYQALPLSGTTVASAHPGLVVSRGKSSMSERHELGTEIIANDDKAVHAGPVPPEPRPSSPCSIPQWKMSPTQRYSRVPKLPDA